MTPQAPRLFDNARQQQRSCFSQTLDCQTMAHVIDFSGIVKSSNKKWSKEVTSQCIEGGTGKQSSTEDLPLGSFATTCTDNDSISCSSISSMDRLDLEDGRRSIFGQYWSKTSQSPPDFIQAPPPTSCCSRLDEGVMDPLEEQHNLEESNIFQWAYTEPTPRLSKNQSQLQHLVIQGGTGPFDLCMGPLLIPIPGLPRKTKSDSALLDVNPVSILRESGDQENRKSRRRSYSVTFDTTVDVILYDQRNNSSPWSGIDQWKSSLLSWVGVNRQNY